MTRDEALAVALHYLQTGAFTEAEAASAPFAKPADMESRLVHALAQAAQGHVAGPGMVFASAAAARPGQEHPVRYLLTLLARQGLAAEALPHAKFAAQLTPGDVRIAPILAEAERLVGSVGKDPSLRAAAWRRSNPGATGVHVAPGLLRFARNDDV